MNRTGWCCARRAAALAAFVAGGYDTVGEASSTRTWSICRRRLPTARRHRQLRRLAGPVAVVQQRVQDRTTEPEHSGALADAGVVDDLWHQFERQGVEARHRVDVGARSPGDIAIEIDQRARAGEFLL